MECKTEVPLSAAYTLAERLLHSPLQFRSYESLVYNIYRVSSHDTDSATDRKTHIKTTYLKINFYFRRQFAIPYHTNKNKTFSIGSFSTCPFLKWPYPYNTTHFTVLFRNYCGIRLSYLRVYVIQWLGKQNQFFS